MFCLFCFIVYSTIQYKATRKNLVNEGCTPKFAIESAAIYYCSLTIKSGIREKTSVVLNKLEDIEDNVFTDNVVMPCTFYVYDTRKGPLPH